jgi:HKD family nuclease
MKKSILFQGVTSETHLEAVRHLLALPNPEEIIFSTAFMNRGGLLQIRAALEPVAGVTTIIAGIRNGITSAQGLLAALEFGCTALAVDTGSRNVIFHPKIYFARNATAARLVLGSANLTIGGLNSNIEASVTMMLDLSLKDDADFVADIRAKIAGMRADYPEHVFTVPDAAAVAVLLEAGRVVDESIVAAPTPGGSSVNRDLDTIPRMKLKTQPMKRPAMPPAPAVAALAAMPAAPAAAPVVVSVPAASVRDHLALVWESRPLTRRYLTIPTGANTNPTGSMLFTKGAMDDIDQRHYFRDEVFGGLGWHHDTALGKEHMERAEAQFRLIIRDVDYGVFTLRLSHNTRTDTAAYEQSNSMTQLHWGEVRPLVAREDLLDRTMYLYRDETDPGLFVLEID